MTLDADAIRRHLGDASARLDVIEVFSEIESTNSYLMKQPAPTKGCVHVVATDNQTAGRGRHGRSWKSPRGSGLCLSLAYSFASKPGNLPALTLAVGLGVVNALKEQGVDGVQLKWPNDLIAMDGKLGGILTEAQSQSREAVTVVTGIGLNVDLSGHPDLVVDADWARRIIDLKSHAGRVPDRNALAAGLIRGVSRLLVDYETIGFDQFKDQWQQHDWLKGRTLTIETPQRRITGVGVGIADDGALLIDTRTAGVHRITSGTVTMPDAEGLVS